MKKVEFLLAICVTLFFATSMTALGQKFIVAPGVVELFPRSAGLEPPHQMLDPHIIGSVTLSESDDGSGAATAQTGGGCLIYYSPRHRECTYDAECTVHTVTRNSHGSLIQSRVEVLGYCAYTVNIADLNFRKNVKKGCWYKPNPESCVRKPDPRYPLLPDQSLEFDNWTRIHPPGVKGQISWRVVSCQNLQAGGCAGPIPNGFQYRYGLITEFQ